MVNIFVILVMIRNINLVFLWLFVLNVVENIKEIVKILMENIFVNLVIMKNIDLIPL